MLWHENQGVTDLPPYKNLVPEIPKLGAERNTETLMWGSLHVLILLLLPSGAHLNLEVLDDVASYMTFGLIQVAKGSLALGQVGLEVGGLTIDVLAEVGLVSKLETLPEL